MSKSRSVSSASGSPAPLDAISEALSRDVSVRGDSDPLGLWLTLTLSPSGRTLSGLLFALSTSAQVAVLQSPAHGQTTMHPTLHLVSLSAVSKALIGIPGVNGVPSPLPPLAPVTHVPLERLEEKERLAVQAEKERLAKLGVGVSDEAQV